MLTLLPLGSVAQPQSSRGIQLHRALEKELTQGKIAHRTAVSAAASGNKPVKEYGRSGSAQRRALNNLTVEYVTDVVGLLGIRRVLWPALRPFLEHVVWNDAFGVPFQPKAASSQ
jgi:hypothetical protein